MEEKTAAFPTLSARLVVTLGDALLQVVAIDKLSLSIGRRPYNDVCLDDLTVSGEHAVIHTRKDESTVVDLNSRNGVLVNTLKADKQLLVDGDVIEVGNFRLKFVIERLNPDLAVIGSNNSALSAATQTPANRKKPRGFVVQLNGRNRHKETNLSDQPIVSLGKAGSHLATVAYRNGGYHLTHIEGLALPIINGETIGISAHLLAHGDSIELGGTMYRFQLA